MSNSIGEILNSKRRELGFSQTELASALAIDGIEVTNKAISKDSLFLAHLSNIVAIFHL